MFLTYATATYNRPNELRQGLRALQESALLPQKIIIHDNSPDQYAQKIVNESTYITIPTTVFHHPENIGLVGAWNDTMLNNDDFVLLVNDDVIVHPYTLALFYETLLKSDSDIGVTFGAQDAYAFFCIRKAAFNKIGGWDELFWPVYYDDNDIDRRLRLNGYTSNIAYGATFTHAENGSATLKAYDTHNMNLHHSRFVDNGMYYQSKWGGLPGEEHYLAPFNNNIEIQTQILDWKKSRIKAMRQQMNLA